MLQVMRRAMWSWAAWARCRERCRRHRSHRGGKEKPSSHPQTEETSQRTPPHTDTRAHTARPCSTQRRGARPSRRCPLQSLMPVVPVRASPAPAPAAAVWWVVVGRGCGRCCGCGGCGCGCSCVCSSVVRRCAALLLIRPQPTHSQQQIRSTRSRRSTTPHTPHTHSEHIPRTTPHTSH